MATFSLDNDQHFAEQRELVAYGNRNYVAIARRAFAQGEDTRQVVLSLTRSMAQATGVTPGTKPFMLAMSLAVLVADLAQKESDDAR